MAWSFPPFNFPFPPFGDLRPLVAWHFPPFGGVEFPALWWSVIQPPFWRPAVSRLCGGLEFPIFWVVCFSRALVTWNLRPWGGLEFPALWWPGISCLSVACHFPACGGLGGCSLEFPALSALSWPRIFCTLVVWNSLPFGGL